MADEELKQAALRELARRELARREEARGGAAASAQAQPPGVLDYIAQALDPKAWMNGKAMRGDDPAESVARLRAALNAATLGHGGKVASLGRKETADEMQAEYRRASQENPVATMAGALATPIPGMGKLKAAKGLGGVALRILANAGIGAGLGAATDNTEMPIGERALWGAGGGIAGGILGEVFRRLGARSQEGVREAWADAAQMANKPAQKAVRSTVGAVGGESVAALGDYVKLQEISRGAWEATPEQMAAAAEALKDPRWVEVVRRANDNLIKRGAGRAAGALQTAENAMEAALASATPEAIEKAAGDIIARPEVMPRVAGYLQKTIPVAAGTAVGGPGGALVGAAVSATMGKPTTAFANMMRSPGFRESFWSKVGTVSQTPVRELIQALTQEEMLSRPDAEASDAEGDEASLTQTMRRRRRAAQQSQP